MELARIAERLRKVALTYPETYEESPWGDRVCKVRGKIFFFCGVHEGSVVMSLKLPQSRREALAEAWAKPTPYGLGKSGWVSMSFKGGRGLPTKRIVAWIDESYRAIAPKRLAAQIAAPAASSAKPGPRTRPRSRTPKKLTKRVALLC